MQREGDAELHVTSRGIRTLAKLPALTSLSLGGRGLVTDETLSALRCMGPVRMMCTERGCGLPYPLYSTSWPGWRLPHGSPASLAVTAIDLVMSLAGVDAGALDSGREGA
jgi:hypothetical protein